MRPFLLRLFVLGPCLFLFPLVAAADDDWSTAWYFSTSTSAVAWGDFDGDGDLDLAMGNCILNPMLGCSGPQPDRVFENRDGAFYPYWIEPGEGHMTRAVAWGDYNNDGLLDLAVASDAGVHLYENTGSGFGLAWPLNTDSGCNSLAWGDLDEDGWLDLVVGRTGTNYVYMNDAGSDFSEWPFGQIGDDTRSVALGDIDDPPDGRPEIAVGNRGQQDRVYRHTGTVISHVCDVGIHERFTNSVVWGDFDNDGLMDLAIAELICSAPPPAYCTDGSLYVYLNVGGAFNDGQGWLVGYGEPHFSIAAGDYDHDGDLDLAAATRWALVLYENMGNGRTFTAHWGDLPDHQGASSIAWADFDGDGDLDLAVGSGQFADSPRVIENTRKQAFVLSHTLSLFDGTRSIAWGDYDGDGNLDLAVGNVPIQPPEGGYVAGQNRVYRNTGGGFALVWESPETEYTTSIAWGDFDNDGNLDLAVGNTPDHNAQGGVNRVYRNTGSGFALFWESPETEYTSSIAWGDFDNDGNLDLAVGNVGATEPNRVYRNTGGGFALFWESAETEATTSIAWGDFDGDGHLDLAAGNDWGPNRVYKNTGDPDPSLRFSLFWSSPEWDRTTSIAWADFDRDGYLDLAAGNSDTASFVYRNTGSGFTYAGWFGDYTLKTRSVAWADYDGDGDPDLAAGYCFSDSDGRPNMVYENTGSPHPGSAFSPAWVSEETDATFSVAWGDHDGDGDPDLAVGNLHRDSAQGAPNRIYTNLRIPGSLHTSSSLPNNPSVARIVTPGGIVGGDGAVEISYHLHDQESDPCSILPRYSIDGGYNWLVPTRHPASEGTTDLASSPAGTAHSFLWDTDADRDIIQRDNRGTLFRIIVVPNPKKTTIMQRIVATTSNPFHLDIPPTFPSVEIHGGAAYTPTRTVNLALSVYGASQMNVSNGACGSGVWEPYRPDLTGWTLAAGDGPKTVCVQYRDWSNPPHVVQASDSIVLDESAPVLLPANIVFKHVGTDGLEATVTPYDFDSGISRIEYAVCRSSSAPGEPGADCVTDGWVITQGYILDDLNGLLEEGTTYWLQVRATNGAGLQTLRGVSFTVDVIGRAIIVTGGGPFHTNPILEQTRLLADYAYMVMMNRGFGADDPRQDKVYYLAPYGAQNPWVDADATAPNLQYAIETWAAAAVNENVPLFLYLVDHGGLDKFLLNQRSPDPDDPLNEFITAGQLDAWLDNLQAATGCKVVVIYDCCYSGSFIDASEAGGSESISGADRVIITSTAYDELAGFLQDGAVSFSHFFFEDAGIGMNLFQCFSRAAETIAQYEGFDQTPQLDDNGDAFFDEADGFLAERLYLGVSPLAPTIRIVETSINRFVTPGLAVTLWADVESRNALDQVWAHIIPPPGSVTPAWDEAMDEDPITPGRHELADFEVFLEEGSYTVEVHAADVAGKTAVPRQIIVTVGTGPYPPDLYEADNTLQTARYLRENVEWQLHGFHEPGDEDWVVFFAVSGFHYDLRTYNPAGASCSYPQVDTHMELYNASGTLLASNDDAAGGCIQGPAAIVNYPITDTGYYYLRIRHATGGSGPGTEYRVRAAMDQGPYGVACANVLLNGNPVSGATVKFKCASPVRAFVGSATSPTGWYKSTNLDVPEQGGYSYYAEVTYTSGGTTYTARTAEKPCSTSNTAVWDAVVLQPTGTGPGCPMEAAAASGSPTSTGREDWIALFLYLVPALVMVSLWRRAGKRRAGAGCSCPHPAYPAWPRVDRA